MKLRSGTMKKIRFLLLTIIYAPLFAVAQDTRVDTLVINGITVIRDNHPPEKEPKKGFFKNINAKRSLKKITTEWGMVDIGMSSFVDRTDYSGAPAQAYAPGSNNQWFETKGFKSRNINIWIVTQRYSLVKHYLNLQYGLGLELNNYFYKQPIRYDPNPPAVQNPPVVSMDAKALSVPPERIYKKDKLAADYVAIPLLLNYNFTPDRIYPFELSAGISIGYLYASRNKTITSDEGKRKAKDAFGLNPWKLSYEGALTLGVVTLYGSYAFKSMYKTGLDMTPYTFGIRLRPGDFFNKIENR
ncbi:MAG: outer membrane beta-barrel protein [Niabella sp.]|nr:outer membrane beta-barrel protein [Niabella sp.]